MKKTILVLSALGAVLTIFLLKSGIGYEPTSKQLKQMAELIKSITDDIGKSPVSITKIYGQTISMEAKDINKKLSKIKIVADEIITKKGKDIEPKAIYYIELYSPDRITKITPLEFAAEPLWTRVKKLIQIMRKLQ